MLQPTDDLSIKLSLADVTEMAPFLKEVKGIIITATTSIESWNEILQGLGSGPYAKMSPIIARINIQAQQQANAADPPEAQLPAPAPPINGPERRPVPNRDKNA